MVGEMGQAGIKLSRAR